VWSWYEGWNQVAYGVGAESTPAVTMVTAPTNKPQVSDARQGPPGAEHCTGAWHRPTRPTVGYRRAGILIPNEVPQGERNDADGCRRAERTQGGYDRGLQRKMHAAQNAVDIAHPVPRKLRAG